jgi:hypothetical protein
MLNTELARERGARLDWDGQRGREGRLDPPKEKIDLDEPKRLRLGMSSEDRGSNKAGVETPLAAGQGYR